jgi:hypothetical protein
MTTTNEQEAQGGEPLDQMIFYTVRFPLEWEARIEALQAQMAQDKPAELLKVSAAAIIRQALRLGLTKLVAEYGGEDAG